MKPLAGLTVVICRPATQSAALSAAVRRAGAEPLLMPLLAVVTAADGGGALADALAELDNYDWIVFTSTNAVEAFVEEFKGHFPERPRVAAVGPATATRLENSGYVVHFTAEGGTAADLAASVPITAGQRVLAPLGDRAGSTLEQALSDRGAQVTRVEAYRTLETTPGDAVRQAAIAADYVFLTSPAIAKRFSQVIEAGPSVVCIGPTTAAAAKSFGLEVKATSTMRGPDGLIDALVNSII